MTLRINAVQRFCLHDGPGIRTTAFLQGCPLRCRWCHNPETQPMESPAATDVKPADLLDEMMRDALYWRESGGGITLSGGEPLAQPDGVVEFLELARTQGIHTVVDTSGAGPPEAVRCIAPSVSLWLWDIKAVSPVLAEEATGDRLTQALAGLTDVLRTTATPVWLRLPVVKSFNTSDGELRAIAEWVAALSRVPPVQILPGHTPGTACPDMDLAPSPADIDAAVRILSDAGIQVTVSPEEPRT
jgi:pyruvate formate lyase activating enzyme